MGKFQRSFYEKSYNRHDGIEQLQKMPWFKFLKRDIEKGEVFPALRYNGSIHFYYKGARICEYNGNLHGIPKANRDKKLFNPDTQDAYEEIKKDCLEWSKNVRGIKERTQLSEIYSKFSPYAGANSSIILLDIEIGFPTLFLNNQEIHANTQVDLLFLHKNTGKLYFVEAKEADDSRIKKKYTGQSKEELYNSLEVAKQLKKYNANLSAREDEILAAYREYLSVMSEIFDCDIYSYPLGLYGCTKLLVYGKSTDNGVKSLDAIHSVLKDDLIVFPKGLNEIDYLTEKITGGSCHA
ncbi:MAG: hypothetical protein PHY44_05845 [Lachnospiraceae bacterium]|nr:hypothetical protein [Lachnospiraceae bacterium]